MCCFPFWRYGSSTLIIRDLELVRDEPAVAAEFYDEVEQVLGPKLDRTPGRVEVLPVARLWSRHESRHPAIALARGWRRQTDRRFNRALLCRPAGSAEVPCAGGAELAVGYVAVPRADLDYAAEAEAELIASGPSFLRQIHSGQDWDIYRVLDATPMVERPARMTGLEADGFTLEIPRAGSYRVRIRATPYWRVESGTGCVGRTDEVWSQVAHKGSRERSS